MKSACDATRPAPVRISARRRAPSAPVPSRKAIPKTVGLTTMILPSTWGGYRQRASGPKALARVHELRVSATALALLFVAAVVGVMGTIGPDARWLGALGRMIAHDGIPRGVPFAGAPSASWPNVPALAELVFSGLLGAFGDRGLLLAQLVAVTFGLV